jgi:hypothetical protein
MSEDLIKIPRPLKQSIALAYSESLTALGTGERIVYCRSLLSLLKTAFVLSGQSKERLSAVELHINNLQKEIIACELRGDEPQEGLLFKKIAQAIDFCGPFVFSGFAEVGPGAQMMKKIELKQENKP